MKHLKNPKQSDMSIEPFNRLVKIAARTFYDEEAGGKAVAVVVLDALTRRQWVREGDLAKALNLPPTQLRRTLQILEEDKLIAREHRREKVNVGDSRKSHTISYCCLDYGQFHDVLRYRLRRLKQEKNEVTVQEYRCPNCQRKYTSLDAFSLISMEDGLFHCQVCDGELQVADSEKPADMRSAMLEKIETQLKPLMEQLSRVKDLPAPEFVGLQAWEAQGCADLNKNGFHGVEVKGENVQSESPMKVLPPWMITQGMNLTKEQRGKVEEDTQGTTLYDDKKSVVEDDKEKINQAEYPKLYYADLCQKQELAAQKASDSSADADERQVGIKSKREDDDVDSEDDVDWEEG